MASTVESIFGIDSNTLKMNKEKALSDESYKLGVLSSGSNPWATSVAGHHTLMSTIDDTAKSIFGGVDDPQLSKGKNIESIFANATGDTPLEKKKSILAGMKEKGFIREAYAFEKEVQSDEAALLKAQDDRALKLNEAVLNEKKFNKDVLTQGYNRVDELNRMLDAELEQNPDKYLGIVDSLRASPGGWNNNALGNPESLEGSPGVAGRFASNVRKLISATDDNNQPLYTNIADADRDVRAAFNMSTVKKTPGTNLNPWDEDTVDGQFENEVDAKIKNKRFVANKNRSFAQGIDNLTWGNRPGEKTMKGVEYMQDNMDDPTATPTYTLREEWVPKAKSSVKTKKKKAPSWTSDYSL